MAPKSIDPTDWLSHALDEMRQVCASMQPSSAEADAEAIRLIASRIQAAAAVYESSLPKLYPEGEFSGETVTGSHRATVAGIRHTDSSAGIGLKIADQISAIAGILSQTQGNIADLDATLDDGDEGNTMQRALHRATIAKAMTDSYSNPVIGANGSLPEYDAAPLPQLGAGFEQNVAEPLGGGASGGSGDTSPALLAGTGTNASGPDGSSGPGGPGGEQATYVEGQAQDTPFTMGSGSDASGASGGGSTPGPLNGAFGAPVAGGAGVGGPTSAAALNTARGGASGGSSGSGLGSAGSGAGRAGGGVVGGAGSEPSPLGRRMPASLVTPATGANQSAGATPSAGSRGGSPMGSPAGGRGAGKDKDGEHRAPSYLHTRENGEEMVGRLPLVGPPVLGDWARVLDLGPTGENSTPAAPGDKGPDDKQQ